MKKYKYALNQYVSDIIFPKERVKDKVQILEILLEASRYILSAPSLTFDKNLGSITLVVDKMSRLFFCKEKKYYSIVFPFTVNELDSKLFFQYQNNIDVDSQTISHAISIIKSESFNNKCSLDFTEPIYEIESDINEDFWIFIRELLVMEDGYIRYDMDEAGYKEAKDKGFEHKHPLNHFDVFYSNKATFKLGLTNVILDDDFIDYLNIKTDCKYFQDPK